MLLERPSDLHFKCKLKQCTSVSNRIYMSMVLYIQYFVFCTISIQSCRQTAGPLGSCESELSSITQIKKIKTFDIKTLIV